MFSVGRSVARQLLPTLPPPAQVVCPRPRGTPLATLVGPVRAVRPVNGGRGFTAELVRALRLLPFANDSVDEAAAAARAANRKKREE